MSSLREVVFMPGEVIQFAGEIAMELFFVQKGVVEYLDGEAVKRSVYLDAYGHTSNAVGEVAFIVGLAQRYTIRIKPTSDASLLVLSRKDYDSIRRRHPEQSEVLLQNVLRDFGLNKDGTTSEFPRNAEEDEEFMEHRLQVQAALTKRIAASFNEVSEAASVGDVEKVQSIISTGLPVDSRNHDRRTLLHLSAQNGNHRVCQVLLSMGADINATDRWDRTPLHDAVQNQWNHLAAELHDRGAVINLYHPGETLCTLTYYSRTRRLRSLIDNGISVDAADIHGRTALHIASM